MDALQLHPNKMITNDPFNQICVSFSESSDPTQIKGPEYVTNTEQDLAPWVKLYIF